MASNPRAVDAAAASVTSNHRPAGSLRAAAEGFVSISVTFIHDSMRRSRGCMHRMADAAGGWGKHRWMYVGVLEFLPTRRGWEGGRRPGGVVQSSCLPGGIILEHKQVREPRDNVVYSMILYRRCLVILITFILNEFNLLIAG
uniref:Uncharacterized protein n=1 Tax=Oryza punctata TaxID=4537 RepID=A0A0E0L077_ORYPU